MIYLKIAFSFALLLLATACAQAALHLAIYLLVRLWWVLLAAFVVRALYRQKI